MNIRVSDASRVASLLEFVERLGCAATQNGENVVDVQLPETIAAEQERMVLDIYLGVWRAMHPDVSTLTVDYGVHLSHDRERRRDVPLYLVWIERDGSLEAPVAHASTHPVGVGDVIIVEREPCHVDRIEAPPDERYDAVIYGHRE